MRILKEIKTHLFYLLSKRNIITLIILNIIILSLLLVESQIFKGYSYVDEYRKMCLEIYLNSSFPFIKIVYIFFILFVNLTFFFGNYSKYSQYFITSKKTKVSFYVTKYISVIIFVTVELIIIYSIFEIIKLLMPYGDYPSEELNLFFYIYLMGLYYLFLSSILLMLSQSNFALLIPIIIFWVSDVMSVDADKNIFTKLFLISCVSVSYESGIYYGVLHAILLIILNILISILIIKNKDQI
ncbi:MAG: hypothetical protein K6G38_00105 [Gammaproteobacteria bacterium]|nr:hypothetical protein [Gammaproteobacteria bacterium]